MRRPLFAVALFAVILSALCLKGGWAEEAPPGCVSAGWLEDGGELKITGQVYQKNETSVYLRSVVIIDSDLFDSDSLDSKPLQSNLSHPDLLQPDSLYSGTFGQKIPIMENIICETDSAAEIPLGSLVAAEGRFSPYSRATNPGEFDAAVYYRTLEVGGKLRKAAILAQGEEYWHVREGLYRLKIYFKERIYRIFPEKEAAVMSALLLGDKSELDGDLKELYKRNGVLHILSISSLHITIIGMSIYRLLRRTGLPVWPCALAGSVILVLYGCMTGFSVSACRAIGMYLIKMGAEILGRTYDMLTALGVMGAFMAVQNPFYLQNSGFLLSFSSVLGIGVVYPLLMPQSSSGKGRESRLWGGKRSGTGAAEPVREFLSGAGRGLGNALQQSFYASLSITLATLPVQLRFYYEIPVYSVFLNLFIIPFLKPMMITGLLAMLVPGLGWMGLAGRLILGGYELLCGCFDRLPFHTWNPGCPRIWQILVYYLILGGAVSVKYFINQKVISGALKKAPSAGRAVAAALCLGVLLFEVRPPAENSVTFLDVGQGDGILVRTASGETYLFDCGSSSRSKIGRYVLIPYLKYSGIRTIDAVFLSHPDADHINGAVELFALGGENNITVKQLLLPDIEDGAKEEQLGGLLQAAWEAGQEESVAVGYLSAGDEWSCGSAALTCLHPARGYEAGDVNAYSQCFLVEFYDEGEGSREPDWTLLLTGDVQEGGEKALLQEIADRDIRGITVLKAAHHGSRNSTPQALLDQLEPFLTVISSGRNNRYGHPHAELLERLEACGTHTVRTSLWGAVTVSCEDGSLELAAPYCFYAADGI